MKIMAPVPVLMVLYSNDAVEIRYTDGSRLELSPCGSTFVHHGAPDRRQHLKHDESRKVQKRTRFVTSEHRQKVVQALDFRNRFAERPYLCEDLLLKEDVVDLYAKIDSVAWPKLPDKIKIEILPDGSRRITSLDEYASLIVSPHGQDFTVCYLSKISPDQHKSKSFSASTSGSSPTQVTEKTSQPSFVNTSSHKNKYCLRPNEAVVHPFETYNQSEDNVLATTQIAFNADHPQCLESLNKIQDSKCANVLHKNNLGSDKLQSANLAAKLVITEEQKMETLGEKEIHMQNSFYTETGHQSSSVTKGIHNNTNFPPDIDSKLMPQTELFDKTSVENKHLPSIPFASDSPNSHDISSISRSSTPDGLRTTIDSEATLTNIAESFHEKVHVHPKRHSSPTHYTSSPNDSPGELIFKKSQRKLTNIDVSLSSSFLGNQEVQNHDDQVIDRNLKQLAEKSNLVKDKSYTSMADRKQSIIYDDKMQLDNTVTEEVNPILTQGVQSGMSKTENSTVQTEKYYNTNDYIEKDAKTCDFKATNQLPTELNNSRNSAPYLPEKCSDKDAKIEDNASEKQHRGHCVWTTKHCSRNECPVMWSHPLWLALEGTNLTNINNLTKPPTGVHLIEDCEDLSFHPSKRRPQTMSMTSVCEKQCLSTTVPSPLPVTCPFQHNHKWIFSCDEVDADDDGRSSNFSSNSGEFQHGRLKIVISEGVVYRLIHKPDLNIIEIYPGDGSILVSQGVKGHFFTHYILVGDQLEERTYSVKSLPYHQMKGPYSIQKLIDMANRLLIMNERWKQRGLKENIPCWKKEVIAVVEPLSSSLLEECVVEGLGKFSAFTNGRVRIVFEDRTALDMVCNFSQRVKECLQHSQDPLVLLSCANSVSPPTPTLESIFCASTGRLLLPSGKYVNVDILSPGPYRKYIQVAQEWAAWVRSSPMERHQFYSQQHMPAMLQQAAEIELRKIFCFNYILEQTMLMQQEQSKKNNSDSHPSTAAQGAAGNPETRASSSSETQSPNHQTSAAYPNYNPQSVSTPSSYDNSLYGSARSYHQLHKESPRDALLLQISKDPSKATPQRVLAQQENQTWSTKVEYVSNKKIEEMNLGFESVRQVLLQNSKLINDIEHFLDNSKKL